jgi:hypothetical protein
VLGCVSLAILFGGACSPKDKMVKIRKMGGNRGMIDQHETNIFSARLRCEIYAKALYSVNVALIAESLGKNCFSLLYHNTGYAFITERSHFL